MAHSTQQHGFHETCYYNTVDYYEISLEFSNDYWLGDENRPFLAKSIGFNDSWKICL